MNFKLSMLTILRSPLRTVITFILLIASGFAFISRGAEYYNTKNTIARAEAEYSAVGTLVANERKTAETAGFADTGLQAGGYFAGGMEAGKYCSPISDEAAELIRSSRFVRSVEERRVAGGLSEEYETVMEQPLSQDSALRLDCAIVIAKCYTTMGTYDDLIGFTDIYGDRPAPAPDFVEYTIEEVLAGDEELWPLGLLPDPDAPFEEGYRIGTHWPMDEGAADAYSRIIAGHRYILSLEAGGGETGTHRAEICTGGFFNVSAAYPVVDLTLMEEEKGAPLTEEDYAYVLQDHFTQLLRDNHHKQDLVYTSDMASLPRFHDGTLYLAEGRMLTPEDTGNVCVINAEFAERNGISVGDTVTFDVDPNCGAYCGEVLSRETYDIEPQFVGVEYTDYDLEREKKEYEVVGIWTQDPREGYIFHSGEENLSWYVAPDTPDALVYARNTVFVPSATYPWTDEEVEQVRMPSTFSFTLKRPGYVSRLEEELGDKLAELGYVLQIDDRGYSKVADGFRSMSTGALVGFLTMAAALLLTFILTVYLYIIRRKSEFAIMRALGVDGPHAAGSLLAGLGVLSAGAAALGAAGAAVTATDVARRLATMLAEMTGTAATVDVPFMPILAFGAATFCLLMVFACVGLSIVAGKPPLTLLQAKK